MLTTSKSTCLPVIGRLSAWLSCVEFIFTCAETPFGAETNHSKHQSIDKVAQVRCQSTQDPKSVVRSLSTAGPLPSRSVSRCATNSLSATAASHLIATVAHQGFGQVSFVNSRELSRTLDSDPPTLNGPWRSLHFLHFTHPTHCFVQMKFTMSIV